MVSIGNAKFLEKLPKNLGYGQSSVGLVALHLLRASIELSI